MAAYKELADKYPQAPRGARRAVHGRAHRGEHRLLRQGRRAVRAAGAEVPADRSTPPTRCATRACCARAWASTRSAIKHFGEYARRYKDRADAKERRVPGRPWCARTRRTGSGGRSQLRRRTRETYPGDARTVEALTRARRRAPEGGQRRRAPRTPPARRWRWQRRRKRRHGKGGGDDGRTLLGGAGALHPGRAGLPRLRAHQDRRQAEATGEGAGGEGQAAGAGQADLPGRRHLSVARVGDGRAAAHRPGLRGVRQGDAQRARARGI